MSDQDDAVVNDEDVSDLGGEDSTMEELQKKIAAAKEEQETSVHDTYQTEIEELKTAKTDADDRAMRAFAELKNAQQRMEKEKDQFAAFSTQSLVMQVLEIYENYHRLMEHKPEGLADDEWHKGLDLIDQQFGKFLESQGVVQVETKLGEQIDPERHEAMLSEEGPAGEILEVFSPGWEMKGRVIKTAKVKVGKAA